MDRTAAALMVAMVACVMAIPLAYIAGKGSAQATLNAAVEDEMARTRSMQDGQFAAIRRDIAEASLQQERAVNTTQRALWKAGIKFGEEIPEDAVEEEAATPISMETFERLGLQTTYASVVKTFGREGNLKLSMEDGLGSLTEQYVWRWIAEDGTSGKVDLSFVNGKLEDKSYKG